MKLKCEEQLTFSNGGVYVQQNWRAHWLRRCTREAHKRSRNRANGLTSGRSSAENRGADCGRNIDRSSAAQRPVSRSRRGWRERAISERIAVLQAAQDIRLRCCPGARSTWRYESFDLRGRR